MCDLFVYAVSTISFSLQMRTHRRGSEINLMLARGSNIKGNLIKTVIKYGTCKMNSVNKETLRTNMPGFLSVVWLVSEEALQVTKYVMAHRITGNTHKHIFIS